MAIRKVIEYGICSENSHEKLAGLVNECIRCGWELYGFVFTSVQHDQLFFHQAMVCYKAQTKRKIPINNSKSKK